MVRMLSVYISRSHSIPGERLVRTCNFLSHPFPLPPATSHPESNPFSFSNMSVLGLLLFCPSAGTLLHSLVPYILSLALSRERRRLQLLHSTHATLPNHPCFAQPSLLRATTPASTPYVRRPKLLGVALRFSINNPLPLLRQVGSMQG